MVSAVGNVREHNEDNFYVPGKNPVRPDVRTEGSGEIAALSFGGFGSGAMGRGGEGGVGGESGAGGENPFPLTLIVADGMGGQQAGEHASRMAVEIIPKELSRRLGREENDEKSVQSAIKDAVAEANQEILGCSSASSEMANMGTTVVLAVFRHDKVYVAGIGDSRAYRLREGRFEQLTKDHSLADALYEAGTITKEEMPNHK